MPDYPQDVFLRVQQGVEAVVLRVRYHEADDGPAIPIDTIVTDIREDEVDFSTDSGTWPPVVASLSWDGPDGADKWAGTISDVDSALLVKGVVYHYAIVITPVTGPDVVPVVGVVIASGHA